MTKYISVVVLVILCAAAAMAKDEPPGMIKAFCDHHFGQDIAAKGEPFNSTDVIEAGIPRRRIIDYFVTSTTSFLWYEHGGRGYHQHLVRFNTARPEEIQASYVFINSKHTRISDLIKDREFLEANLSKSHEL